MTSQNFSAAAFAFCVATAAAFASPAVAATKHHHHHHTGTASEARAQALDPTAAAEGVSAHRAQALRECSVESGKLVQKDWGVRQSEVYGSCMMEHGEAE